MEHVNPSGANPRVQVSGIARSAILVIALLLAAKLFSLVEQKVALDRFGITLAWDTFTVANAIPEQLFNLLAGRRTALALFPLFGGFLGPAHAGGGCAADFNTP